MEPWPLRTKVRPSEAQHKQWRNADRLGVVVGYSRDGRCIYIRRPGTKTAYCWWRGFWELVPRSESTGRA